MKKTTNKTHTTMSTQIQVKTLIGVIFCLLLSMQLQAQTTINCNGYNPWVSTQVYTNETVVYNNELYTAQWYNVNANPSTNTGNGLPWVKIQGTCSLPITYAGTSCANIATWQSSVAYQTGAQVVWNNYLYQASFYTLGTQPDQNANYPWKLISACSSPGSLTAGGSLTAFTAFVGSPSAAQSFTLTGTNLSNNVVTISAPANFSVSLTQNGGYTSELQITPIAGAVNTTIYVEYTPSTLGTNGGNITITCQGITTLNIPVSGSAQAIWMASGNYIYNANSGNVGIGTGNTAPQEKLHVVGKGLFTDVLKAPSITLTDGAGVGKVLTSDATGAASWQTVDLSSSWKLSGNSNLDDNTFIGSTNAKPVLFKANNAEAFRITADGKIAIGSNYVPTGYSLSVNGKVIATEVAVYLRNKWPDYTFSKDYKLLTLSEVERYIQQHKHLPGMPPAEQVEKEGMKVGEINVLLVEKVEELTLHAIQHEKTIKAQAELIEKLTKQLEEQNKRLEKLENK